MMGVAVPSVQLLLSLNMLSRCARYNKIGKKRTLIRLEKEESLGTNILEATFQIKVELYLQRKQCLN